MGFESNSFLALFSFLPTEMQVAIVGLIAFLIGLAIVRIVL